MALTSPGVQVSVIDESFYTPAEPGTTPMIFVATAENKSNASGTGTAQGTLKANAGKPYLLTSQRDLADTFGDPLFYTDNNNNPIHAGELNEYGLHAAYSYLGVSNRAWVVRADLDLGALEATASAPNANPADGTYWLDTASTTWGIQEWNGSARSSTNTSGQSFTTKTPIVITSTAQTSGGAPKSTVGAIGDYAVVATGTIPSIWYRSAGNGAASTAGTNVEAGTWVLVGSEEWTASWPVVVAKAPTSSTYSTDGESITIGGSVINITGDMTPSELADEINSKLIVGLTAAAIDGRLYLFSDGTTSGDDSSAGGLLQISASATLATELGFSTAATDYLPPAVQISKHTSVPEWKTTDAQTRPTGSVWIKTTTPNGGANWKMRSWNDATQLWEEVAAPIYSSHAEALYELDRNGGGANIPVGDIYVLANITSDTLPLAQFTVYKRVAVAPTSITGAAITDSSFAGGNEVVRIGVTKPGVTGFHGKITEPDIDYAEITIAATGADTDADVVAAAITAANIPYLTAEVNSSNKVVITHTAGGEIRFTEVTAGVLSHMGFTAYVSPYSGTPNLYSLDAFAGASSVMLQASNWKSTTYNGSSEVRFYTASDDAVTALAEDGALWYNSIVDEVDIMVHNGSVWKGYREVYPNTDDNGPIVSATEPTSQSDGSGLQGGDIWISTADLENYPMIYVYDGDTLEWVLRDNSDQTTESGVLFADARWTTLADVASGDASTIADLLLDDFVDPDAPDPALYPKGMLLWNLRRSGFNVKKFVRNYIDVNGRNPRYDNGDPDGDPMSGYYPHRWVTESGNQSDGAGSFGRKAQRKVVVQALQAMVNSNDEIRDDESRVFNLMATPGYPELIGEMISLNYDRGLTAFVVGDSPARLTPDATSLNEWATNVNLAPEDNDDGLVSRDEYFGIFYPWGFTSDNFGNNVVVPPSHMMLRTMALSDQVSYPWFAPAGTRRGGITNATATGYVDAEGEFVTVALNEGQRDTLYAQAVNPITFINGAGLVNYGQKTRARGSSALDRINVARLVIYLRSQLNKLAKPYIFEPNDKITRDQIKQAAESLMLELVGQRALYDFLVVCDESNNTPSRIDRNELYLDIAIEPVKAVEFIYIPLRLKNTGEIAGL